MRVLHVTNCFPNDKNSSYGIFVKEQIASLEKKGIDCQTIFIDGLTNGKLEYFRKIRFIHRSAEEADIIHCHHSYSAFITRFFSSIGKYKKSKT